VQVLDSSTPPLSGSARNDDPLAITNIGNRIRMRREQRRDRPHGVMTVALVAALVMHATLANHAIAQAAAPKTAGAKPPTSAPA
jgi:hypothetical protein